MTLDEEVAALRTENAVLREQMAVLVARVRDLEARLALLAYQFMGYCFQPSYPL